MFRQIMTRLSRKTIILLASVLLIAAVAVGAFTFQTTQETHAAGYCPPQIGYGSTGHWVSVLQSDLNSKEGAGLKVDGQFGSHTSQAVYNWQRYHAFPSRPSEWDKIVGPHTWASLGQCDAGAKYSF
jgi:peptidoglycan hydrolase-like protein with peptidoglycan-binding domain